MIKKNKNILSLFTSYSQYNTIVVIKIIKYKQQHNYKMDITLLEMEYLESLSKKERDAYTIAKTILGSSFSLIHSCGYIQWYRSKKENEEKKTIT